MKYKIIQGDALHCQKKIDNYCITHELGEILLSTDNKVVTVIIQLTKLKTIKTK